MEVEFFIDFCLNLSVRSIIFCKMHVLYIKIKSFSALNYDEIIAGSAAV